VDQGSKPALLGMIADDHRNVSNQELKPALLGMIADDHRDVSNSVCL